MYQSVGSIHMCCQCGCLPQKGKQAQTQKAEKFVKPRKHFCCLRLTKAHSSIQLSSLTCSKDDFILQEVQRRTTDNSPDGEPFLGDWTKNLAYLVEQNKTKKACNFIQTSYINNQRENSPLLPTLMYRTAAKLSNSTGTKQTKKQIINQSTSIQEAPTHPTPWKFQSSQHRERGEAA